MDNGMAKITRTKRTSNDLKCATQELIIEHTRTPLITGVNPGSPENKQFPFY
jgi:hypothetical protein